MKQSIPSKNDVEYTFKKVQSFVHRTPVLTSTLLNEISGATIYFKCENFQKTGSFKMRGAVNAIQNLSTKQKERGVVTHSSGNFAQAIALAAKNIGIKAYIVMPSTVTKIKREAVKKYGGIITISKPTLASRQVAANKIAKETGATFLHPSNNTDVILGQGTAAIELLEEHPMLDIILVPVGGGGLLAGTALAATYFGTKCKVIAGEPLEADDAYRSMLSGKIEDNVSAKTIADGLRTTLGNFNFPIIKEYVSEIIRVDEPEIIKAMQLIWERMNIVIEPSSAVPFAALLKNKEYFKNKKIGIILSGGNVDLSNLPF